MKKIFKKKVISGLLIGMITVSILSGCGKKNEETNKPVVTAETLLNNTFNLTDFNGVLTVTPSASVSLKTDESIDVSLNGTFDISQDIIHTSLNMALNSETEESEAWITKDKTYTKEDNKWHFESTDEKFSEALSDNIFSYLQNHLKEIKNDSEDEMWKMLGVYSLKEKDNGMYLVEYIINVQNIAEYYKNNEEEIDGKIKEYDTDSSISTQFNTMISMILNSLEGNIVFNFLYDENYTLKELSAFLDDEFLLSSSTLVSGLSGTNFKFSECSFKIGIEYNDNELKVPDEIKNNATEKTNNMDISLLPDVPSANDTLAEIYLKDQYFTAEDYPEFNTNEVIFSIYNKESEENVNIYYSDILYDMESVLNVYTPYILKNTEDMFGGEGWEVGDCIKLLSFSIAYEAEIISGDTFLAITEEFSKTNSEELLVDVLKNYNSLIGLQKALSQEIK